MSVIFDEESMIQNGYLLPWQLLHIKQIFGEHSPQVEARSGNPMALVFQTGEESANSRLPREQSGIYFCAYKVSEIHIYAQLGPVVRFKSVHNSEFDSLDFFEGSTHPSTHLPRSGWYNPDTLETNTACYIGSLKNIIYHRFFDLV